MQSLRLIHHADRVARRQTSLIAIGLLIGCLLYTQIVWARGGHDRELYLPRAQMQIVSEGGIMLDEGHHVYTAFRPSADDTLPLAVETDNGEWLDAPEGDLAIEVSLGNLTETVEIEFRPPAGLTLRLRFSTETGELGDWTSWHAGRTRYEFFVPPEGQSIATHYDAEIWDPEGHPPPVAMSGYIKIKKLNSGD